MELENAVRLAALINQIKDKSFFKNTFSAELQEKYINNPDGLVKYYKDNFEYIYREDTFLIDEEIKLLGLSSNRTMEALQKLIELLGNEKHSATARKLLSKYTKENFETQEQWQVWYESSKDRIYFSDFGGYKFFVAPKGYLDSN